MREKRQVEVKHRCDCCFDDEVCASKGVFCGNIEKPHFICGSANNDCFSDLAIAQANDQGAFVKNNCSIMCAYCSALVPRVNTVFDLSVVAKHATVVALNVFINAGNEVMRCQGMAALEVQGLQHADELQKLKEALIVDKKERLKATVQRHRLNIIDSILTLRCPHCNLAIFDFDGCFAVEHKSNDGRQRQVCGLYFCGWCLDKFDSNKACHDHVKFSCPHNPHRGEYHGSMNEFNTVHSNRRSALVLRYLQDNILDADEREETRKVLKDGNDLRDIGIKI